ncbi:hypothetical protein DSL72_008410 [Monilinia vaccinii-corymbosi]|uniref:F-box domain-containing protein n=1 Tax=Monilinia vaccinii-corymbosi TaxID=61207 RepID=A0A8A3PKB0_9HELO|nr:hypothetical protein DSL72_008410 [Monilinia vaccinii-corymbosi]
MESQSSLGEEIEHKSTNTIQIYIQNSTKNTLIMVPNHSQMKLSTLEVKRADTTNLDNTVEPEPILASDVRSNHTAGFPPFSHLLSGVPRSINEKLFHILSPDQIAAIQTMVQCQPRVRNSARPFLDEFPIEVRRKIYSNLLVNPRLGDGFLATFDRDYDKKIDYGLSPALLRVSKQLYEETMEILYGENYFFIECYRDDVKSWNYWDWSGPRIHVSPLTRHQNATPHEHGTAPLTLYDIQAIKHVRHWKAVVGTLSYNPFRFNDATLLTTFCRSLLLHPPRSLEILILPKRMEDPVHIDLDDLDKGILRPLLTLHKDVRISFRTAGSGESVDGTEGDHVPFLPSRGTIQQISERNVKNGTYNEHLGLEYKSLLKYAQSFERIDSFKDNMAHPNTFNPKEVYPENPYKCTGQSHPVEKWLQKASEKSGQEELDVEGFKTIRRNIVQYLEPQYQRISSAGSALNRFIKKNKQKNGILEPHPRGTFESWPWDERLWESYAEAMLLLEAYIASFDRDAPYHVRIIIRKMGKEYRELVGTLPRNVIFRTICRNYDDSIRIPDQRFVADFRKVVDDCTTQWLEIRHARKRLFQWDHPDVVPEINLELASCDEMVNWDVCEPNLEYEDEHPNDHVDIRYGFRNKPRFSAFKSQRHPYQEAIDHAFMNGQQEQSFFREHLPSSAGNPIDRCPLLNKIPIECRKQIWDYLLRNPLLGECFAADNNRAKFGLYSAILSQQADIQRGHGYPPREQYIFDRLYSAPQLDRAAGDGGGDDSIIPAAKGPYVDEYQLAITLSPLERLRNIDRFTIRPAESHEIPNVAFAPGEPLAEEFVPILPDPVDENVHGGGWGEASSSSESSEAKGQHVDAAINDGEDDEDEVSEAGQDTREDGDRESASSISASEGEENDEH